ncbi:hypothetical protein M0R45_031169 [Rubus argutus]|uniref:Uncharacterized protein n=1 Tax=Rubus argutus TaxID=59490 RepID=A0AAW1WFE4_RUBAR
MVSGVSNGGGVTGSGVDSSTRLGLLAASTTERKGRGRGQTDHELTEVAWERRDLGLSEGTAAMEAVARTLAALW